MSSPQTSCNMEPYPGHPLKKQALIEQLFYFTAHNLPAVEVEKEYRYPDHSQHGLKGIMDILADICVRKPVSETFAIGLRQSSTVLELLVASSDTELSLVTTSLLRSLWRSMRRLSASYRRYFRTVPDAAHKRKLERPSQDHHLPEEILEEEHLLKKKIILYGWDKFCARLSSKYEAFKTATEPYTDDGGIMALRFLTKDLNRFFGSQESTAQGPPCGSLQWGFFFSCIGKVQTHWQTLQTRHQERQLSRAMAAAIETFDEYLDGITAEMKGADLLIEATISPTHRLTFQNCRLRITPAVYTQSFAGTPNFTLEKTSAEWMQTLESVARTHNSLGGRNRTYGLKKDMLKKHCHRMKNHPYGRRSFPVELKIIHHALRERTTPVRSYIGTSAPTTMETRVFAEALSATLNVNFYAKRSQEGWMPPCRIPMPPNLSNEEQDRFMAQLYRNVSALFLERYVGAYELPLEDPASPTRGDGEVASGCPPVDVPRTRLGTMRTLASVGRIADSIEEWYGRRMEARRAKHHPPQ